jgi:hypothetical protein
MIRPDFREILLDQRGAAVLLWCFFFAAIPVYFFIAQKVLETSSFGTNRELADPARVFFWLLALLDIGYYLYWKRKNLTAEAIRRDGRQTKLFRALQHFNGVDEQNAAYLVSTLITRKVVIYAIIEAIAVYGFVLALIGRFVSDQVVLSGLSLALLTFEFPGKKSVEKLVESVEKPSR